MQGDSNNKSNSKTIQESNRSIDEMTQQQLLEYQRQLMAIIVARRQKKLQQQKVEKLQNEQEYERPPTYNEQRISQSVIVNPNQLNNSINRQPSQHDSTFPTIMQKANHNLRSTRAYSQQSSQNSFSQSQDFSNYLSNGNVSQEQSTLDHTANTSNFSYKTANRSNELENIPEMLENLCNQSLILSESQRSLDYQQILKLSAIFSRQFKILGLPLEKNNLIRALKSQQKLRSWKLFVENKDNGLFTMDLVSQNGISINQPFFLKLKDMDLFLLYRIEIGPNIKLSKLIQLLQFDFDSLRQISFERIWNNKKQEFKEHGLEIIKNINNRKRLTKIEWKTDKLTKLFAESFKDLYLISLAQLQLYFSQKVKEQDEQQYGDLLEIIFDLADVKNQVIDGFKIILHSSIKNFQNLGRSVYNYKKRLYLRTIVSGNQAKKVQQQPVQSQRVQQAQQIPRPAQQVDQSTRQPVPQQPKKNQQPQPTQLQTIPQQPNPLLNQLYQQLTQQLLNLQPQQQPLNPNNSLSGIHGQTVHHYGGVNINPSNHSTMSGPVNVGSTSNTYNYPNNQNKN